MTLPYDQLPLVMQAIEYLSVGHTETQSCDYAGIGVGAFKNYIKHNDELQSLYQEAMQRGYDAMAEALLSPDNHAIYGHSDPKMAKVQSDNIKWFLEKRKPKEYGQRVEVNHHITADKAITQALAAARQRALPDLTNEVIDVIPVRVQSDEEIMAELFEGCDA